MLYSTSLIKYSGELPQFVISIIKSIRDYFGIAELQILQLSNEYIVIPIKFSVSVPPNGPVDGIDIRSVEPVLIQLSLLSSFKSPAILSDRKDFPREKLSHLYAMGKGVPAKLCLIRGDAHEWFAGQQINNLLDTANMWFYKAVTGQLNTDGNEFDPIRLERYRGQHIYSYDKFCEIVDLASPFIPNQPFSCLFTVEHLQKEDDSDGLSLHTLGPITALELSGAIKLIAVLKGKVEMLDVRPMFSIVVWHPNLEVESEYQTNLPTTVGEMKAFFEDRQIDIELIVKGFVANKLLTNNILPIIYAIKRPLKMIGFNGQYEFLNFAANINLDKKNNLDYRGRVSHQLHIEPFSNSMAKTLSGEVRDSKTFFIGGGSLGSKIIMHDARSGKLNIAVCDPDSYLEHNQVRHTLSNRAVGLNKATTIISELNQMNEIDPDKSFKAYAKDVFTIDPKEWNNFNWIVDTTASLNVLNWLTRIDIIPQEVNITRCELVNSGKLGLLYIEGKDRNPRIDDLINLAYFRAFTDENLENWRRADFKREVTTLNIGLGCSSSTTVMTDDAISFHAAIFSKLLYNQKERLQIKDKGLLFQSILENSGIPQSASSFELVDPFEIYMCSANSSWEVRLANGLTKRLLSLCDQYKPKETGGVLIGMANYKTCTIHVFDIIEQPADSLASHTRFTRGIKMLPELIEEYKNKTGGIIGYIGEWHSHPMNLESLSSIDKETISELQQMNRLIPIPTCAVIVTPSKVIPFVFE